MIKLNNICKQYTESKFVLKDINYWFNFPGIYTIDGVNGSGKSTLVGIIGGYINKTKGTIEITQHYQDFCSVNVTNYIHICSPYIDYPEDFSLKEIIDFNNIQSIELNSYEYLFFGKLKLNIKYKTLSSGMQQKFKLLISLNSPKPILIFDEPFAFLDNMGEVWFRENIIKLANSKLIIYTENKNTKTLDGIIISKFNLD